MDSGMVCEFRKECSATNPSYVESIFTDDVSQFETRIKTTI